MADGRVDRARRLAAAVSAAWARTIAFLAPRCRRVVAASRSGWVRTVAFLAPRYRRAVAAGRSGAAQAVLFLVARFGQTVEFARTMRDRAGSASRDMRERGRGLHRRSRTTDLRGRVSHLVKQRSEIERAEYVALTDLLEKDERDPQYQ